MPRPRSPESLRGCSRRWSSIRSARERAALSDRSISPGVAPIRHIGRSLAVRRCVAMATLRSATSACEVSAARRSACARSRIRSRRSRSALISRANSSLRLGTISIAAIKAAGACRRRAVASHVVDLTLSLASRSRSSSSCLARAAVASIVDASRLGCCAAQYPDPRPRSTPRGRPARLHRRVAPASACLPPRRLRRLALRPVRSPPTVDASPARPCPPLPASLRCPRATAIAPREPWHPENPAPPLK